MSQKRVFANILEAIGNTPMVRINSIAKEIKGTVYAKIETTNPGNSIKDRMAVKMIEDAERSGALKPGGTIIEGTSGNTGMGLAIAAVVKGYKCVFTTTDKQSKEKADALKAFGAEVIVCPTNVDPDDPRSYYSVSSRLEKEVPNSWKANQYDNPSNSVAHYEQTGPEIWDQTEGKITHLVVGVGTGGTISGVGRYLKEKNPKIKVWGIDTYGSVYSGGSGRPYLVEGVGEDFWPETYDRDVADRIIEISDADSFEMTRRLAREDGLLVGGSSGMAAKAAIQLAHELDAEPAGADAVIVVLLPDSGRGYLTKVFNDDWLAQYGFLTATGGGQSIGEVLRAKRGDIPALVHTHPNETIAEAIHILQEYGVSQMPVVRAEPPVMAAEVAGSVSERVLLDALYAGKARLADPVEAHMSDPLPTVGATVPVGEAVAALEHADALLVQEDGRPVGVLTRQDLLAFIARA